MIGGSEILLILLAILLLFGSDKLPDFARSLGKGLQEFKKATDDIKREITESTADVKRDITNLKNDVQQVAETETKKIQSSDIYPNTDKPTTVSGSEKADIV